MHPRKLSLLLLAAACGGSDADDSADATGDASTTSDAATGETTAAASTTEAAPVGPTYYQDVAPVLSERCGACHVAGGVAPFALSTYEQARMFAPALRVAVELETMPPWPPGGATPALLHDRSLPPAERELLLAWVDAGAPEGDAADPAPLREPEHAALPAIDLATDLGVDYAPDASLSDDYRCFVIDLGTTEDRVAVGYHWKPGNKKIVHHVLSTLFTADSAAAIAALDDEAAGPGWPCFGGYSNIPGAESVGALGGWVPGVTAVNYPAGTGAAVPAGALLVLQVHYNLGGGTDPDRTSLDLAFAPPEQAAGLELLRSNGYPWPGFTLPAGEAGVVVERTLSARVTSKSYPDGDAWIVGVAGHMHMLGTQFGLTLVGADGERPILEIPAWDFHWQGSYTLVEPIRVAVGDDVRIRCVYDNTAEKRAAAGLGPPVDVTWGEGTSDEMCLAYLQLIDELP
ncbi:MAG: monooxygenase [Myxococcales bacterium]|nr:monooxygenase [Myxococcales bacterium]